MLKNYVVLAYRSLLKNKIASGISIAGLAVAIGCSIVAYSYISAELLEETMHENASQIFQVQTIRTAEDRTEITGLTPEAMGPILAQDIPQIEHVVRIREAMVKVLHDDHEYQDHIRFVDPEFFDMFTIPLVYGSPELRNDPDALILSEQTAIKYFGETNPVGQSLTFELGEGILKSYTVRGVAARFPFHSVSHFTILTTYSNFGPLISPDTPNTDGASWDKDTWATFLKFSDASDSRQVEPLLTAYVDRHNAGITSDYTIQSYRLDNLKNLKHTAHEVSNSIGNPYPAAPMILLGTIALFLFLLSCFNYINITLGAANARVKEIGIRKVIGSKKRQIVGQFLTENLLLCFIALIIGVLLAGFFMLPGFNGISGMNLHLDPTERIDLWQFLIGTLLVTALVSGSYPAFYVASFKPVAIFTGTFKSGGPNRFMKILLTGQFVMAFVTMMMCIGVSMNYTYLRNLDWGYDKENTLVIRLTPESYSIMHDAAAELSTVSFVTGARNHIGTWGGNEVTFTSNGQEKEALQFDVGDGYFDVIRLRLIHGTFPTLPDHILINEQLASLIAAENPIGQTIQVHDAEYQVAGVAADFHYTDFGDTIEPAYWKSGDPAEFGYLIARFQPENEDEVVTALASVWNSSFPDDPGMNYYFQDESFDRFFYEFQGVNQILIFTAILALLLSCAGLFGIAAQHTASKMKEMSIRKILGASVFQIAQAGNRQFVFLLILAAVLATPVSYVLLTGMLESFMAYRMSLGPGPFLLATALILLIALVTVSSQVYKLVTVNPAELLKDE